ncbi:MAG: serine/threonine protein kinase [Muribaculaceae bacterium]|nr:serine/threonine protein kinase [Muribaculaceae bacterium]
MDYTTGNIRVNGRDVFLYVDRQWYHYDSSVAPLGAGAMGTVYLGRNCKDHHDLVAIKQVNPAYARYPAIRERARLEARLAFRHRNLVEMIGCCEEGGLEGPMFIVSRLVQGVTLDKYVERTFANRPDRVKRIINCIFPVLEALDYIHSKGIIHLDIKPSNIMVENGSNIRLMDLGIAYTHTQAITASGLLGTPGYAAPEQYISPGQTQLPFDARTDIYQLGVTLYELISGVKPYQKNPDKLDPLPGVSRAINQAIGRALALDQSERYETARQFSTALKQALIQKPSLWERIFKK